MKPTHILLPISILNESPANCFVAMKDAKKLCLDEKHISDKATELYTQTSTWQGTTNTMVNGISIEAYRQAVKDILNS